MQKFSGPKYQNPFWTKKCKRSMQRLNVRFKIKIITIEEHDSKEQFSCTQKKMKLNWGKHESTDKDNHTEEAGKSSKFW